jgi:pimeloyl-ACP methyl ester carboxylesterase
METTMRLIILLTLAASLGCTQSNAQQSATPRPRSATQEGFVTADDGIRLYYSVEGVGAQTVVVPAALYLQRDLRDLAKGRRSVFSVNAQRIVPVGFSYLGLMVMLYAAEHPDRVERIVQIGSVPRRWDTRYPPELTANDPAPVPDSAARAELSALRRSELAARDPQAHCERERELTRVGLVGNANLAERVPNVCEFPNEWPTAFRRHLGYHFVGSVQRLDVPWETFQHVTVPVLTVHGTKDRNAPYGGGREWATRLPNARLLTVPGAAHMPWIDQPALVLGAIETFLNGAWPMSAERVPAR